MKYLGPESIPDHCNLFAIYSSCWNQSDSSRNAMLIGLRKGGGICLLKHFPILLFFNLLTKVLRRMPTNNYSPSAYIQMLLLPGEWDSKQNYNHWKEKAERVRKGNDCNRVTNLIINNLQNSHEAIILLKSWKGNCIAAISKLPFKTQRGAAVSDRVMVTCSFSSCFY